MRYAKKLAVAGAALLISAGSASAGPATRGARGEEPTGAEQQPTTWDATGSAASGPGRASTAPGAGAGGSTYVTRDELDRRTDEIVRRLERAQAPQPAAPTFTDEG